MSIYDKASLVLIPSGSKTSKVYSQVPTNGDGDFTFSRSTAATRVNASGNIEKETQNLLLQSNSFDTSPWYNQGNTITSGQAGYDGSNDAWLLETINVTNAECRIRVNSVNISTGVQSFSVYAKAGSLNVAYLQIVEGSNNTYWFVNLTNGDTNYIIGAGASPISVASADIGGGWYRLTGTWNSTSTTASVRIGISNSMTNPYITSAGGESIYIQDAQLEQGLVARDYIETTTTAIYGGITDNVPRLDYTDSSCPALLLEPQRTNVFTQSEFLNGYFTNQGSAQLANELTSPEGVDNALKLYPTSTGTYKGYRKEFSNTLNNSTYTISIYAKAAEFEHMFFYEIGSASGNNGVWFNLATGNVGTTGSAWSNAKMTDMGDGWYRCEASVTYGGSLDYLYILAADNDGSPTATASGTNGLYLYGAQMEEASYATSYIPTYGSAVTRNADNSVVTSAADLIGQTEGTMFFEGSVEHTPQNVSIMNFDRSTQFSVSLLKASNDKINAFVYNGGSSLFNIVSTAISGKFKCAVAYKSGDTAFYVNGTQIGVNTTTFTPAAGLDEIYIGSYSSPYFAYDHPVECNQALVFKTRLSNEELATLTTI